MSAFGFNTLLKGTMAVPGHFPIIPEHLLSFAQLQGLNREPPSHPLSDIYSSSSFIHPVLQSVVRASQS